MANMSGYQGGGDIRLSGFTEGVYGAFREGRLREEAKQKEAAEKAEKSQEAFQKSLAESMAKVNTKGLQDIDIPEFQKLYAGMEDAYIKASQETDKSRKLLGWAKVKEMATKATMFVQQSESVGKKKAEQMKVLQSHAEKYDADSALKALQDFYGKPSSQINGEFSVLDYRNKWDSKQLDKSLDDLKKNLLDSLPIVPTEKTVASSRSGFDTINTFQISKTIPKEAAIEAFKSKYNTDKNFQKYIDTEFDGTIDTKLTQLYENLGSTWSTSVKEDRRVAGRAPQPRSSSGGSGNDASTGVNTYVDLPYSGTNTVTANKQTAFKGNAMKARLSKGVRAFDMDTGDTIDIHTGMQDGTVLELVNLPTGEVAGKGRRILVKGTEKKFEPVRKDEDFAVVRYKEPVYHVKDSDGRVFTGSQKQIQEGVKKGTIVKSGQYNERTALFPANSVLPNEASMTKSERATLDEYRATRVPTRTSQSKVLNR